MGGISARLPGRIGRLFAASVVATSILAGGVMVAESAGAALPAACSLLTVTQASTLAGTPVNAGDASGDSYCQFTAPTSGPEAQVEISVDTQKPRAMQVDRKLGHQFTTIPHLGDEAYEEDWNIFVRKGSVWIGISLVRPDGTAADYAKPLQTAAAEAIARVPAGAAPTQNPPPTIVGDPPAGTHTNPVWTSRQERLYGGNLDLFKNVVWQPDVVLIPDGPNAIRGVSPDGLTWTLTRSAAGVSKLHVGAIMAATTQALGRVEAIKTAGPDVQVTLGPVDLPQVFEKAEFQGANVPLTNPLFDEDALPTGSAASARTATAAPRIIDKQAVGGNLHTGEICCAGYIGEYWTYDHPLGRLSASIEVQIPKPTIDFDILIDHGLQRASLRVNGATGLDYHLGGATKSVDGNFNSGLETDPISATIPLASGVELTLSESFHISMQLAGAAAFGTRGDYTLTGDLGFTYQKGQGTQADALAVGTGRNIFDHSQFVGNGTNSFVLAWKLRATLGVGLAGFTGGAYVALTPSLGISENGAIGTPKVGCLYGTLSMLAQWGVGYTIPNFALKLINSALGAVGAKPIGAIGGQPLGAKTLFNEPNTLYCPS